jgi:hypothetical protein
MKLAGVIYLYDITQPRMLRSTAKNLKMFQKLCGEDALKSVILGTTKWGPVESGPAGVRENELRTRFWKHMMENGSTMHRFANTRVSGWDMLHHLLHENFQSTILHIQDEVVNKKVLVPDTEAGRHLLDTLRSALETHMKMAQGHEENPGSEEDEEINAAQKELSKAMQSLKALQIPLSRRMLIFLGIAVSCFLLCEIDFSLHHYMKFSNN